MKILGIVLLSLILAGTLTAQWTQTAGPDGGTVTALAVSSNGNLYARSTSAVYRSTDGGAHWSWITSSLPGNVGPLGLYASGSDVWFCDGSGVYNKYYHSTDNGDTWSSASWSGYPVVPTVNAVIASGATLLSAVNANGFGTSGVYASTDNGATWTISSTGLPSTFVPGPFYAMGSDLYVGAMTGSTSKGVYVSTNGGSNWTRKDSTLMPTAFASIGTTLYVSTLTQGIWMGSSGGSSWTKIGTGVTPAIIGAPSIAANGTNLFVGIAGQPGIYKVNSAGTTWDSVATGLPPRNAGSIIYAMAVHGTDIIASFTGLGVYRTTNSGALWAASNNGLHVAKVGGVYSDGTYLYASGITTGYFRSGDHGDTWAAINDGLDLRNTGYFNFFLDGGVLLAGGGLPGYARSTDGGDTWSSPTSLPGPAYAFVKSGGAIYAGTLADVVKTTDLGLSWTTLATGNPGYIAVVAVWKDDVSLMAAASAGFKRSTDDGATWTAPYSGLPGFGSYHAFTQMDSTIFLGHDAGVYRSTDHGATWSATAPLGLGITPIALHVHGDDLFVGTSAGVYRSTNHGTNWTTINEGLPIKMKVSSLCSDGLYLYAGMDAHSVWRRPLAEVTDVRVVDAAVPSHFTLAQNFPNPFNPSTTIRFDIAERRHVTVAVYDLLGREVERLVDGETEPGTYELRWDAASRPSGIYYYRIQAGSFSETRSMLLVR